MTMLLEQRVGNIKGDMMKVYSIVAGVVSALILSGCATANLAPKEQDIAAKEFKFQPEKASIYLYRNEVFGAAVPLPVSVNGKNIGRTVSKSYFHLNLKPGKYNFESQAEDISNLELNLEPNKKYYIWQEVKMGMWMARSLLQGVDESTGQSGVIESNLLATTIKDDDIAPLGEISNNGNIANQLRDLQKLRTENVISEEDFQSKKQELLKKL